MELKYYENGEYDKTKKSIFLAGPTPRNVNVKSWRNEAIQILKELNFDGEVYVPESIDRAVNDEFLTYTGVIDWELERLENAKVILFWIPRDLETLPGFTTNVEFGYHLKTGKIVYGRPNNSPKTKYLDYLYKREYNKCPFDTLEDALKHCVELTIWFKFFERVWKNIFCKKSFSIN